MVTGKVEEKRPKAEAHYAGLARSQNRPKELSAAVHQAVDRNRWSQAVDKLKQSYLRSSVVKGMMEKKNSALSLGQQLTRN